MKKLLVLVFAIALCLGVLCLGASADYSGKPEKPDGTGTVDDPYKISSAENLYWFAGLVNGDTNIIGSEVQQNKSANAVLTDNITVNEDVLSAVARNNTTGLQPWTPIGTDYTKAYTGTFDGQSHTISGLYYSDTNGFCGLFGYVGSGGQVKNVKVADSYINDTVFVGGVCGYNYGGTITNCSFDGSVTGTSPFTLTGGVCGINDGTLTNCYNTGSVTGVRTVGGVCGSSGYSSTITNCYNDGSVTATGDNANVGGVCGQNDSTITNCYNTGSVTGTGESVGGVCGRNDGTITNCYNTGSVSGTDSGTYTGGVCGCNDNRSTITNCYWREEVSGLNGWGINNGTVTNVEPKTNDQFASGEVAWLLNGEEQMNGPWRQNLGDKKDAFPVLDDGKPKVHYNGNTYDNGNHTYSEGSNGFCTCGAYQPATLDGGVYQISNAGQLYWFAGLVNGGEYGANAELTANITINENVLNENGELNSGTFREWTPIGEYGENGEKAYTGTFDGDGHTIRGLYYDGSGDYVGLFGYVGSNGRVQNVNVADSYISNNEAAGDTGGVCGCNRGTITNCSFSGSVTCKDTFNYVGGVCGWNAGTTENSYNAGTVTSVGSSTCVGGVCGYNNTGSTIRNCYNTGAVNGEKTGNGDFYAGGVCGYNRTTGSQNTTIENCYNTGSVSVTGLKADAGGVCGNSVSFYNTGEATITDCYNIGEVSGTTAGGVCGRNIDGTITNCYWLSGTADGNVGSNNGTVTDVESKTADQFASGEVAWLLNSDQENGSWRQNLSDERDDYPVLDSTHKVVVKLTVDGTASYHNEGYAFSGETDKAYFKDGAEIELPYTVNEDTELTSAALYVVTVDGVVSYVDPNEPVFKLPAAPSRFGYTFVGWSDGNKTYEAGDGVTITADTTFTAVWREINIPDPNSITVTQPENGTVKVNPSNGSAGTLITVTATPDEGYELAYITVDGEKITGNTFRMPDKSVTVSAVFVPATFPFVDVKTGDWFYDYVAYVYSNGLMDGTSGTAFEPNANMTRAMVWAILARIDGETVTGAAWATDARAWAMAEGVSDGTDPNGLVTREQFATMLYRYAVAKGYDVSIGESTNILSYADFASISEYAIPAMQWACGSGIITGVTDSTLAPQGTATRAQCAAMLMRFAEL